MSSSTASAASSSSPSSAIISTVKIAQTIWRSNLMVLCTTPFTKLGFLRRLVNNDTALHTPPVKVATTTTTASTSSTPSTTASTPQSSATPSATPTATPAEDVSFTQVEHDF